MVQRMRCQCLKGYQVHRLRCTPFPALTSERERRRRCGVVRHHVEATFVMVVGLLVSVPACRRGVNDLVIVVVDLVCGLAPGCQDQELGEEQRFEEHIVGIGTLRGGWGFFSCPGHPGTWRSCAKGRSAPCQTPITAAVTSLMTAPRTGEILVHSQGQGFVLNCSFT